MVRHPNEGGPVDLVVPGGDLTIGIEIADFVRGLRLSPRHVLPLELTVRIENVHPLLTHLGEIVLRCRGFHLCFVDNLFVEGARAIYRARSPEGTSSVTMLK